MEEQPSAPGTFRDEGDKCKSCGKFNDSRTGTTDRNAPKPGDISVCFYCGHIGAFGDDLAIRDLTDEEMVRVAGDEQILRIQRFRALFFEWKKKRDNGG